MKVTYVLQRINLEEMRAEWLWPSATETPGIGCFRWSPQRHGAQQWTMGADWEKPLKELESFAREIGGYLVVRGLSAEADDSHQAALSATATAEQSVREMEKRGLW